MALDEAVVNEWPGREVGVFVSIGTGKRPEGTNAQQHLWWEGFVSGGIGDFAEARRRLISKIEGCEKTHKEMKDHLAKRHVNPENYYRLNVNVGVGEFGMNEWNALAEISTNTRMYLAEQSVQGMTMDAAAKIARIHFAKIRWERAAKGESPYSPCAQAPNKPLPQVPDPAPMAVELPAEELSPDYYTNIHPAFRPPPTQRQPSDNDKFLVVSSGEHPPSPDPDYDLLPRHSGELVSPGRRSADQFTTGRPVSMVSSANSWDDGLSNAPPRPPKTPLQDGSRPPPSISVVSPILPPAGLSFSRPPPGAPLPYPDTDGPPPIVNKATKPDYTR